MKKLTLACVLGGLCAIGSTAVPTTAVALETYQAKAEASDAAERAALDMMEVFGFKQLKPGQYLWRDVPDSAGPERVVVSISDQVAYLYRGNSLVAVARTSTGRDDKPTPTGIFSV